MIQQQKLNISNNEQQQHQFNNDLNTEQIINDHYNDDNVDCDLNDKIINVCNFLDYKSKMAYSDYM